MLLLHACWAPEIADLPPAAPEPPPEQAQAQATEPPLTPPPSTEVFATPEEDLPPAPFTGWTTDAPLTLVGPGGKRVAEIARAGVRVDVKQILAARILVVCRGCTGADTDAEGWLPLGHVRAARTPGRGLDPLTAAVKLRARWASGADLPIGGTNNAMCLLVDRGFVREGERATWESDGGRLVLELREDAWRIAEVTAGAFTEWSCRTDGGAASPPPPGGSGPPVP